MEERLQALRQAAMLEGELTGLDDIRGPEDRALLIRFMKEVYHEGTEEGLWKAKHPKEYARVARICGTVPADPGSDHARAKK
jgi:hypothetical protein